MMLRRQYITQSHSDASTTLSWQRKRAAMPLLLEGHLPLLGGVLGGHPRLMHHGGVHRDGVAAVQLAVRQRLGGGYVGVRAGQRRRQVQVQAVLDASHNLQQQRQPGGRGGEQAGRRWAMPPTRSARGDSARCSAAWLLLAAGAVQGVVTGSRGGEVEPATSLLHAPADSCDSTLRQIDVQSRSCTEIRVCISARKCQHRTNLRSCMRNVYQPVRMDRIRCPGIFKSCTMRSSDNFRCSAEPKGASANSPTVRPCRAAERRLSGKLFSRSYKSCN